MEGIGWDVVTLLIPFLGQKTTVDAAQKVLSVVMSKGNAKEVFLKCVEGIRNIIWEREPSEEEHIESKLEMAPTTEATLHERQPDAILQTTKLYHAALGGTAPPLQPVMKY